MEYLDEFKYITMKERRQYFVYILSGRHYSLYIGVTSNLQRRVFEHKNKINPGFTTKYRIDRLVYFEVADSPIVAIEREKQLKRWHRQWKINLITQFNPQWKDLSEDLW